MSSRRREQLADFLRDEVSEIIHREMKDPRLGFASITRVELSPDLRYARVFVSVLGSDEELEATLKALTGASGYIRRVLLPRMHVRHVPELTFRSDRSMEHAEQIARTLNQLREQLHPPADAAAEQGKDADDQA
ncbi:MAG TPA: 30S ribosome-binding factor RbfA [Thermomicrobiaceae bacterium]|nr:30S ribosome-binding factor RbfA [Thermomicrobiaceae bacterium]